MPPPCTNGDENLFDSSIACRDYGYVEWQDWMSCIYKDDLAVFRYYLVEDITPEPNWGALLHPDEIERGCRYLRKDDRLRSLYTRSLLKILVGRYTFQNPVAIRLINGLRKKPELSNNPGWHFNATHSGNWILIIIGKYSVGVDIEAIKPEFSIADLIPISFSNVEKQYIEADEHYPTRFYELWTRKEALVKAIGSGIDDNFSQVPSLTGFHKWESTTLASGGDWTTNSFYVAEGYPAAIAYKRSYCPLRFYSLDYNIFVSP